MTYGYLNDSLDTLTGVLSGFFGILRVPYTLLGIAGYVLTALALYTISQRRGIHKPWLAWIPVVNCWLLGSLSDQYQYVVNGANKSKRKFLLGLSIVNIVLGVAIGIMSVVMVVKTVFAISDYANDEAIVRAILGPTMSVLGLCIPLLGVSIAYAIIRYMALYDVYKSLDPSNCVLFLVLSILFGFLEPFFLFFSREKDLGMPPRRRDPASPVSPAQEPWENENKDYL